MDIKTKYKAKKIKAVFFDIDDTLRRKSTGYLPESIQTVFSSLKQKNILTGIASGRAMYGIVPEIRSLKPDYLVTVNGAYVINAKGDEIDNEPLDKTLVKNLVDWCLERGVEYGFAGKDKAVLSARKDWIDEIMIPVYGFLEAEAEFYVNNDVYNMWTFSKDNMDLVLPSSLSDKVRLVPWDAFSSDIIQKGISKASGLDYVLKSENLKPENVLFFGDGLNDVEMFDHVGLSIAMGDAHPQLKEKADYVTETLEEDGIYNALEKLGLIEKKLSFPQLHLEDEKNPVAVIKTNYGDLEIALFEDKAPKTVENFITLAKDGYYDGVIFHRIIKDFMIQGGDPTGTGMGGESIYGSAFEDEFSEELFNIRGAVSMANAGPNTNGSQFFIVQNTKIPYTKKELIRGGWPEEIATIYATQGGTPHLDRRHTVFGQLINKSSFDVLDRIASVETGIGDKPIEDVVIRTIEVKES